MALGARPVKAPVGSSAGISAAVFVAALIFLCFAAVFWRSGGIGSLTTSDMAALRFTVLQAVLSAVLSVVLAVPVARALARRQFRGRRVLILLLGAPFILPSIVAILGLLAVFGRSGWLSDGLALLGLEPIRIYGLHGVVLAHVFFNLPLAVRLLLQGWQEIPAERFRLAAQLGARSRDMMWLFEWPMLRRVAPGIAAVIFAICLTSFAVALTLGGGPKATTLELAIYQAFRFDFDLSRAALLAILQVAVAGGAALLALRLSHQESFGAGFDRPIQRWDAQDGWLRVQDAVVICGAALFLCLPLLAVVTRGLSGLFDLPASVWFAALSSVFVAALSTALLLAIALPMAAALGNRKLAALELAGLLGLAASPLALGTGLFLLINPFVSPAALALPVTALVNAIMALPFALRILVPAARDIMAGQGRLALSLDLTGMTFVRLVFLPRLRPQIGFAAGLTAALSMGDLGVIALFADPERATLPLQIYRLMGAYRMEAAAGAALLLLILSLGAFWALDRGGRGHADT